MKVNSLKIVYALMLIENNYILPHTVSRLLDPSLHVMLMTHSECKENLSCFQDCRPAYVVLYDADVALIRGVEAYQSTIAADSDNSPVKVFFLLYGE